MKSDNFNVFAKYYDLIYGPETYQDQPGEIDFFIQESKKSSSPILELGCGTGRVTIPTAQSNIEIIGLDFSAEMLEILEQKAEMLDRPIQLIQGNMINFKLEQSFDLITIPLNSIHHITNPNDQHTLFKNIHKHLNSHGRCIFTNQFYNSDFLELNEYTFIETYDQNSWGIELDLYLKFDPKTQTLKERFIIFDEQFKDKQTCDLMDLYPYTKIGLEELLNKSGFNQVDIYQDFKYTPFQDTSDLGVWVVTKD